jgi:hypothetical protein
VTPTTFPEANRTLTKPEGWTDEQCGELPTFSDGESCISCWSLSWRERLVLLFTGRIWLWVWSGRTQPPVALSADPPFAPREEGWDAPRARNRLAKVVMAMLGLFWLAAGLVVYGQEPPTETVTVSIHTGAQTLLTRGEKREYAAARVTLNALISPDWAAFTRADLTAAQDGGALDLSADPASFRTLETAAGIRRRVGPLSIGALGGVTWSIEGDDGAPVDSRLWTVAGVVRASVLGEGYVYVGAGLHQPVDGGALLVSAAIPVGGEDSRASTFLDIAVPFKATAFSEKAWTLRIGAAVRVWRHGL